MALVLRFPELAHEPSLADLPRALQNQWLPFRVALPRHKLFKCVSFHASTLSCRNGNRITRFQLFFKPLLHVLVEVKIVKIDKTRLS
jgi:hypothetical protein